MDSEQSNTKRIVLVPGIGLGGCELLVLGWYLKRQGFHAQIFWRNPWRRSLQDSAELLHRFLQRYQDETVHLVGHSLGGLVVLQTLQDYPTTPVGKIVTLGTPHCGCLAARRVLKAPGGRGLLGEALVSACHETILPIPPGCAVGAIAGSLNMLLGFLLCPQNANDTLVCVNETQHPDLTAHCILPVSHSGMVMSHKVSIMIARFLHTESFSSEKTEKQ